MVSINQKEANHYNRHLMMPDVGIRGQKKLKQTKVLLIGAGGLGAPIAQYLAAAGIGQLTIIDPDTVDVSNLQRQILYTYQDAGTTPKAQAAAEKLAQLNPHITITPIINTLNQTNADNLIQNHDIIIDGTDNFPTRYLASDACVKYNKPLIHAAIYQFDGQLAVLNHNNGPCYRCLFPQPPTNMPNCAEAGVLGILPGVMGTLQATQALKLALGKTLPHELILYDAMEMTMDKIPIQKNPDCICNKPNQINTQTTTYTNPTCTTQTNTPEVTVEEAYQKIHNYQAYLIDVRELHEYDITKIPEAELHPKSTFNPDELPVGKPLIIHCKSGARSKQITKQLCDQGINAYNLKGGIEAWNEKYQPTELTY